MPFKNFTNGEEEKRKVSLPLITSFGGPGKRLLAKTHWMKKKKIFSSTACQGGHEKEKGRPQLHLPLLSYWHTFLCTSQKGHTKLLHTTSSHVTFISTKNSNEPFSHLRLATYCRLHSIQRKIKTSTNSTTEQQRFSFSLCGRSTVEAVVFLPGTPAGVVCRWAFFSWSVSACGFLPPHGLMSDGEEGLTFKKRDRKKGAEPKLYRGRWGRKTRNLVVFLV